MKHSVDGRHDAESISIGRTQEPFGSGSLPRSAASSIPGNSHGEGAIREELERLVNSRTFHSAEAQKRFLRFVVEHTILGRTQEIKEYTLGVEVFKRGKSFDPRLDPIVRVEARKLRSRLAKYYEGEGLQNSLRIELHSRGYVPIFQDAPAIRESSPPQAQLPEAELKERDDHMPERMPGARAKAQQSSPRFGFSWRLFGGWKSFGLVSGALSIICIAAFEGRLISTTRAAPPVKPSIAVLPFHNIGGQDESFSDGLTDELISSLGRVQGLQVVARTSAFQFRGKTGDIREIGKALNVRMVLDGSVRIYENRLRITAELDDTSNGYRVWSNSYDQNLEHVLLIQRDISRMIVAALRQEFAKLGAPPDLRFSPSKAIQIDAAAYQDYLRGLYFWNKQTPESIKAAMGYFEQSIAKEPSYAPSYSGLARCYANLPAFTKTPARDIAPKIRELALKAMELDSSLAEPHIDLAYASYLGYNWEAAEKEFKTGLDLGPGDAVAHRWYSMYLANVGRMEEGLSENEISQQLDPVSPYVIEGTARALSRMRRYDEAIAQFEKALMLDPQFAYAHLGLGATYIQKHMYSKAIAELELARQKIRENPWPVAELACAFAYSGNTSRAKAILRDLLDQSVNASFPSEPIAAVYIALGEKDAAFQWLAKAVAERDVNLYLKSDPVYDSIRSDPRFGRLLQTARL